MLDVISKSHWAHVVPFHPKALVSPWGMFPSACVLRGLLGKRKAADAEHQRQADTRIIA